MQILSKSGNICQIVIYADNKKGSCPTAEVTNTKALPAAAPFLLSPSPVDTAKSAMLPA